MSNRVGLRLWNNLLADEKLEFVKDTGRNYYQTGAIESGQAGRTDDRLDLAANSLRATGTAGEDRGDGACHGASGQNGMSSSGWPAAAGS